MNVCSNYLCLKLYRSCSLLFLFISCPYSSHMFLFMYSYCNPSFGLTIHFLPSHLSSHIISHGYWTFIGNYKRKEALSISASTLSKRLNKIKEERFIFCQLWHFVQMRACKAYKPIDQTLTTSLCMMYLRSDSCYFSFQAS